MRIIHNLVNGLEKKYLLRSNVREITQTDAQYVVYNYAGRNGILVHTDILVSDVSEIKFNSEVYSGWDRCSGVMLNGNPNNSSYPRITPDVAGDITFNSGSANQVISDFEWPVSLKRVSGGWEFSDANNTYTVARNTQYDSNKLTLFGYGTSSKYTGPISCIEIEKTDGTQMKLYYAERLSDNEGGLFDVISNRFYVNNELVGGGSGEKGTVKGYYGLKKCIINEYVFPYRVYSDVRVASIMDDEFYFDTGIAPSNIKKIEVRCNLTDNTFNYMSAYFFGCGSFKGYSTKTAFRVYTSDSSYNYATTQPGTHTYTVTEGTEAGYPNYWILKIDDGREYRVARHSELEGDSLYLFKDITTEWNSFFPSTLYYAKITLMNGTVKTYKYAERKSDNQVGFLETGTNTFYPSAVATHTVPGEREEYPQ